MNGRIAAAAGAALLLVGTTAFAHRIDEYLQATVLSLAPDHVEASLRMVPGISVAPAVIAGIDSNGDGTFSDKEEREYAQRVLGDLWIRIDGRPVEPQLISWSFPQPAGLRAGLGEIHIQYAVDLPSGGPGRQFVLENHHLSRTSVYLVNVLVPEDRTIRVLAQTRNEQQTVYEVDYEQAGGALRGNRWGDLNVLLNGLQIRGLFALGMRHIAEGTDHLLFLLTLLLPAPLRVCGTRWGSPAGVRRSLLRILGIVTAFTIGHSATLTLAALGAVHVPSRPVEVLIAVSILVSAMHACRPILPGKEAWIAGFFGLIHGLAFAATLDRLGLGIWERLAGILSFNFGIETMQMLAVAAILPALLLMSRTRAYPVFRVGGGVFAGAASLAWIFERLLGVRTPVDTIVNGLARHAVGIAVATFAVSLVCRVVFPRIAERGFVGEGGTGDDGANSPGGMGARVEQSMEKVRG